MRVLMTMDIEEYMRNNPEWLVAYNSQLGRVKPPSARRVRFWVDVPDAALGEAALEDAKVISDGSSEETKDKAQTP